MPQPVNTFVSLVDRRGRILWSNQFPEAEHVWYYGRPFFEDVHPCDVDRAEKAFAQCIIRGETTDITLKALFSDCPTGQDSHYVNYQARYYPAECEVTPIVAAVVVGHIVPDLELNPGDKEVLKALMNDKTIKEIADLLDKSQSTIDARVKNLKDKLGVETLPGLVASAMKSFLVEV